MKHPNLKTTQSGFFIEEILIVLCILGIFACIAIPVFNHSQPENNLFQSKQNRHTEIAKETLSYSSEALQNFLVTFDYFDNMTSEDLLENRYLDENGLATFIMADQIKKI